MYHGISAFNRSSKIHDLISRVAVLSSVSACYADRPIGPIGVYCDIDHADRVDYIAEHDVWSYVDDNGTRQMSETIDADETDYVYPSGGDDLYALYCEYSRKADNVRRFRRYAEIAAIAHPAAIWVDPRFGFIWVKRARVIAKKFGLIVMFVKSIK
jgi:hypothetical protein